MESVLKAAAAEVYETADHGETLLFAQRLQAAFAYCKQKAGMMSSGKKLHPSVFKVCQGFEAWKHAAVGVAAQGSSSSSSSKGPGPPADFPVISPSPRRSTDKRRMRAVISDSPAPAGSPIDRVKRLRRTLEGAFGSKLSIRDSPINLDSPVNSKGPICIDDSPCRPSSSKGASSSMGADDKAALGKAAAGNPLEYMDSANLCLCRYFPNGLVENAAMSLGPNGFALATFAGCEPKATELPNLMLQAKTGTAAVLKRPAAVLKRPARKAERERSKSPELIDMAEHAEDLTEEDEQGEEESNLEEDAEVEVEAEPAQPVEPESTEGCFKGGNLVVTCATLQSYIQEKLPMGKKRLVVAVAKNQSDNHQAIIRVIFETLKEKPLFDKALAIRLRREAL